MTQEKFKQRAEATVERIRAAKIDDDLADTLVELVEDARIATNGLTTAEKMQVMSENQFSMAVLLVQTCIATMSRQADKASSWRSVLVACKREITIIAVVALGILVLRPQLLAILSEVIK